ncbi:MAG: hypothetical protein AAF828_10105 [Bacteroidota bacterium]
MTTEQQRQLLDLQFLEGLLNDVGIPTRLTEQSDQYILSFLSVQLEVGSSAPNAILQLMYIPTAEVLRETNLLQFFAYLSDEVIESSGEINAFLAYLNTRTPVGYFALDAESKLFYRYVYPMARFKVPAKDHFMEIFDLFRQTFAAFGSTLCSLAAGKINYEAATQAINGA